MTKLIEVEIYYFIKNSVTIFCGVQYKHILTDRLVELRNISKSVKVTLQIENWKIHWSLEAWHFIKIII